MNDGKVSRITLYREFWPHYLREHSKQETRKYHFAGTAASLGFLLVTFLTANPVWLVFALIAGYGPAWYAHFRVEKNRPATFTYPIWSLVSDFRMFGLWVTGQLSRELRKANPDRR